ncbi:MAG TPA: outer membrane protein transport protein [Desulfomonilia bacterium]|nr:outer membrane protein transport protein [Desulfomonilia bacterium]
MRLNRFWSILGVLGTMIATDAYAQIDNLTNMSAEWVRLANRNAATDAADIVVYNPAGLVCLSDGFHLNVSNQTLFRRPEHTFTDPLTLSPVSFEQDDPDWFVPNVYAAYTRDRWSVFAGIYIPGNGASLDYPDGSITTRRIGAGVLQQINQEFMDAFGQVGYTAIAGESIEASSLYLTGTIGGAYKITDCISIAAGVRYIQADNDIEGELTLTGGTLGEATPDVPLTVDVEQSANGWGAVFGIQAVPIDGLVLALRYESKVSLNFKDDVNGSDNISQDIGLFVDGDRNRRDFPAMIGFGASYQITPELRGEADFNYFFQEAADWGRSVTGERISDMAGDVWSWGLSAAYLATPELEISAGFLYTDHLWDDMDGYFLSATGAIETLYSDNWNLSTGIGYRITPAVKLNLGVAFTIWEDETINTDIGPVKTENNTTTVAVGVDLSF